ncbi:MAG: response regulator [Chloroflexales bacterium]|nr:response regulator [Chloroflexales bacterium]
MAQRILIVDDSPINLKAVTLALTGVGYEVVAARDGREGLERAETTQPDMVILDVQMPELDGYEVCRRLRRSERFSTRPIMMLTANNSLHEKVQGLEAGADDYMGKPFEAEELQARVKALLRRSGSSPSQQPVTKCKVIALFSLRGGVGVSSMAVNLAAGLAQLWGGGAALVDMVFTGGHSGLMLNLPLRHSWGDLATKASAEIDAGMLDLALLSHPSGLRVLPSAPRPEENEPITGDLVASVLGVLRSSYSYIVLDMPHSFGETTLAGLDAADEILLMLAPEIGSVVATTCALDVFSQLGYSREKVVLMLNAHFERGGLPRKDIEKTLGRPLDVVVPFAHDLFTSALNRGAPPVIEMPTKPLGSLLEDIAFGRSDEDDRRRPAASASLALQRVHQRAAQRQRAKS